VPSGRRAFELFQLAAQIQSPEFAELILERIDVEKALRKGNWTECRHLVLGAASAGLEDLMKRLKEVGRLFKQSPGSELNLPLCSAIEKGRVGMVKLLLAYGADPNGPRPLQRNLHSLRHNPHPLQRVLDAWLLFPEEHSPPLEAYKEITKVLRQRGAVLPDDWDFFNGSLISVKTLDVFHMMLEECRDLDDCRINELLRESVKQGEEAFELALTHLKVELQPGREAHQEILAQAAIYVDVPILKRFLDAGFDVNSRELGNGEDGFQRLTLLGLVATAQPDETDRETAEFFGEPDAYIEDPVSTARWDEKVRQAADLLVERGADIEGLDETGQTSSLFTLVSVSHEYELSISKGVKLLLDLGADPFFTNRNGDTALTKAAQLADISIVKVLVEFFEQQGDAPFQQVKESVVRAATTTHSPQISKLLWHYYWPRVYPCP